MKENENGEERRRRRAPKGHFVVYVGKELRRWVLPLWYLKDSKFQKLMEEAAKEYGYGSQRRVVLPCEESAFKRVTDQLKFNNNGGKFWKVVSSFLSCDHWGEEGCFIASSS